MRERETERNTKSRSRLVGKSFSPRGSKQDEDEEADKSRKRERDVCI